MKQLRISPELTLPTDVVTQKLAFLGRTGSGKTYAATKLAELMLSIEAQIVALDPVGKWYGLRIGAAGGKGFEIPVLGGLFGDLPLEPAAGALVADLIVDRGISAVLDVSQFETDAQKARFAEQFADRFFFRKKAAPSAVHVFLEECQEFVPQNPNGAEAAMLHHWTRLAKLGRNFGIGLSLISQRPQEVNKKVLNMTEGLFAFQMRGPQERKTIKEWSNDKDLEIDIVEELPGLPQGTAFVSSPQWLEVEKRIQIAHKVTADVSATPTVGATAAAAKPLTPIDLEQLRTTMAATIEKAKADDPKELRKEIAQLKRDLAAAAKGKAAPDPAMFEATIQQAVTDALLVEWKRDKEALKYIANAAGRLEEIGKLVELAGEQLRGAHAFLHKDTPPAPAIASSPTRHASRVATTPVVPARTQGTAVRTRAPGVRNDAHGTPSSNGDLAAGEQRILNAIAELNALGVTRTSRAQVGVMAGYNLSGGTPGKYVSGLVDRGYLAIAGQGELALTELGRHATITVMAPATLDELHGRVFARLNDGEAKLLRALIRYYPDSLTRAALGAEVG